MFFSSFEIIIVGTFGYKKALLGFLEGEGSLKFILVVAFVGALIIATRFVIALAMR